MRIYFVHNVSFVEFQSDLKGIQYNFSLVSAAVSGGSQAGERQQLQSCHRWGTKTVPAQTAEIKNVMSFLLFSMGPPTVPLMRISCNAVF